MIRRVSGSSAFTAIDVTPAAAKKHDLTV